MKTPKLPLTDEERKSLRRQKVKLSDLADLEVEALATYLHSTVTRARYLRGLAIFQTILSIGPKVAQMVVDLGYFDLEAVKFEKGDEMVDRLEKLYGYWVDPCVEDCFRCIVHHANDRESEKHWFDFTTERKAYRATSGYPSDRPTQSWYA
ncbi:helix-hairpin-helix domain-containing protein [Halalkalibacterium halodurans]|uniref:BH3131 protein n=1 Tax=Halalkalibacterium halodurans (strain ATCC BAA-125 / DSM 18197 / FERM 7344 / JCM 9153 / C-125) TaxID=272558 RepID=Q9K875_HALH5|nr:helix-hairpin-helix domain-containing protein [Halalkalibacterium halodurans]MED4082114.1 helix-hairpin-helix domain-containing protein [Halalkalibacterium halodurans]MED4084308.1 helix-hairpin-helix domain-containing protein [Halalkalibacterium halodurans]MED4103617.1 helix-hairpin-helix domain-containing protein [Halalkalibacterium halodurans]MED4107584.1 helix-hairpin-helix domain-containing protein [Halalkalibacterium halodurans]MED4126005.1 helix-hairpin-helix domain-containing protein